MKKAKLFIINSIVVVTATLILKTIFVSFNVYVSNEIGLAGMGLMELIMSVFSFSVIVACSGIGLGSTRLVAEELAKNAHRGIIYAMRNCFIYSTLFGVLTGLVLFFGADFIGTVLLGDERTVKCLPILALSLPFYSAQCVIYGYFNAVRKSFITSIAQLFEVGFRIAMTVYFLKTSIEFGIEETCLGLMKASTLSEVFAFSIMIILYLFDVKKYRKGNEFGANLKQRMLKISLPVAFSSYLCSALFSIRNIMIPMGLVKYGLSRDDALSQFGVISGMVVPLILFPAAFLSTFSSLIIPEITEAYKLNNQKKIDTMVTKVFQVTLIFTIGIIGIFLKYSSELGMVVYKNINIGFYIKVLTPLALIAYLDGITDAMLKGLDKQVNSMFYNIFDSTFSIILVFFMLPKFGLNGLLLVMFASKLLNTFLSINKIAKCTNFKINYVDWLLKPLLLIFISVTFGKILINIFVVRYTYTALMLTLYIAISIVIYFVLVLLFGCISKRDIATFKSKFR